MIVLFDLCVILIGEGITRFKKVKVAAKDTRKKYFEKLNSARYSIRYLEEYFRPLFTHII